jgi:ParB family chromosome partitioning protein
MDGPTPSQQVASLIEIDQIQVNQQPRRYFDPESLAELTESIKQHGILQPLLVRPKSSGKYAETFDDLKSSKKPAYELIAGERRYRAATLCGLTQIPVVVRELNDSEALQLALVENLQREDLNPLEETEAVLQLLALHLKSSVKFVLAQLYRQQNEAKGKVTRNVTGNEINQQIEQIFHWLGINWVSFVRNRLPLLKLPSEIKAALRSGQIAYTKAVAIAKIPDEQTRTDLLKGAIAQNLSLSQIKQQIATLQPQAESRPDSIPDRLKTVTQQIKKSKVWSDPKKKKKLEKLLTQLEALTQESVD